MMTEGWAFDNWGGIKMHYYRDRKSLCKRFDDPRLPYCDNYEESLKCKLCMKRLEMKK